MATVVLCPIDFVDAVKQSTSAVEIELHLQKKTHPTQCHRHRYSKKKSHCYPPHSLHSSSRSVSADPTTGSSLEGTEQGLRPALLTGFVIAEGVLLVHIDDS